MEAMLPVHPQTLPRDRLGRLVRASRELRPCDPEPDAGDHIVGEDVRGSDPESGAATPASGRSERHRPTTRALRIRPAVLVVILAALLVLTAGAVIVYAALYPRDGRPGAAATPTPFPGTAAPGWSQQPRWVSPVLDPGGGRVVAVDDAIAYMRADRSVDLVDATTGVARWSAALPAGTLHGGLAATSIDGARVIAAQVDNTLAWWSLDKGAAGSIDLPDGAETTFLGGMPLVGLDARTVAVVSSGTLRQLSVPSGAYALAADAQGRVTAASGRGWWHLRPGVAPGAVTAWEQPSPDDDAADAAPQVVGYLGDSVLLLFPPDRAGSPHVVAYGDAADSQQLRVSFRGRAAVGPDAPSSPTASAGLSRERDPASGPPSGQPWWPSPSGTWGVLGRTLVDLRAGSVTDLGAWTTTWITSDRAYGTIDGKPVQAGPGVERTDVGATVTIPEVVTSAGAAMRAAGSDGERLYLLPPAT
ncbi:hypothetical protein [Kineosphaera limosa]|nr:hypothetical protein [Kineosphaera limosa]